MKRERSTIKVLDEQGNVAKAGFKDPFDALEWAEKNLAGQKVIIRVDYKIKL